MEFRGDRLTVGSWTVRADLAIALLMLLGFASRVAAAFQLPLFHDEGQTFLAAQMVSEKGVPILPSGVLYLHGSTLAYVLSPLAALGLVDLDNLGPLRMLVSLIAVLIIPATYLLARKVSGSTLVALGAALLVTLDPISTMWGGYLRMYALLELLVCLAVLLFLHLVDDGRGAGRRVRWGFVAVLWLAVFTHLSAALLLPAMAVLLWFRFGRALLGHQRSLLFVLAAAGLAPVVHILLTTLAGQGTTRAVRETDWLPGMSFLGDDQFSPARLLAPNLNPWFQAYSGQPHPDSLAAYFTDWVAAPFSGLVPPLLLLASGLLVASLLFGFGAPAADGRSRWRSICLLALHWFPVLVMCVLARMASGRYFIMVTPLAWTIVAVTVAMLWNADVAARTSGGATGSARAARAIAIGAALVIALYDVGARVTIQEWSPWPLGDPRAAMAWLKPQRQPGQIVIDHLPVLIWLGLDRTDDARFLSRYDIPNEFDRYARFAADGQPVDYWIGDPMIGTLPDLCTTLAEHEGSWVVWADHHFLQPLLATSDQMLALAGSGQIRADLDGTRVLQILPVTSWSPVTIGICEAAGAPIGGSPVAGARPPAHTP